MADPRVAFKNNPCKKVKLDLIHEAAGPAYGSTGANHKVVDPEKEFAKAHYEQHMKVHGTVEVDGEVMQIDGLGLRDHSWGPRYWQAIHSLPLAHDQLRAGLRHDGLDGLARPGAPHAGRRRVPRRQDGPDRRRRHRHATSRTTACSTRASSRTSSSTPASSSTSRGKVMGFIPLRNRREGMTTHVGEGHDGVPLRRRRRLRAVGVPRPGRVDAPTRNCGANGRGTSSEPLRSGRRPARRSRATCGGSRAARRARRGRSMRRSSCGDHDDGCR